MLSIILLILQVIAFLCYPPILFSIISGHNVIADLDKTNCKEVDHPEYGLDTDPAVKKNCHKLMNVKNEVYAVMVCFILAIIMFAISIYFEYSKNTKLFIIFISIGMIFSLASMVLLFYIAFLVSSILKSLQKDADNHIRSGDGTGSDNINPEKYVWYMSILPIMFTLITVILTSINAIKYLTSKKRK